MRILVISHDGSYMPEKSRMVASTVLIVHCRMTEIILAVGHQRGWTVQVVTKRKNEEMFVNNLF